MRGGSRSPMPRPRSVRSVALGESGEGEERDREEQNDGPEGGGPAGEHRRPGDEEEAAEDHAFAHVGEVVDHVQIFMSDDSHTGERNSLV